MAPTVLYYPSSADRSPFVVAVLAAGFFGCMAAALWFVEPASCPNSARSVDPTVSKIALSALVLSVGLFVSLLCVMQGRELRWQEIVVADDHITFRGRTETVVVRKQEITNASWRCRPIGGALVIGTASNRSVVRFDVLRRENRAVAIRGLRRVVRDIEQNWPEFCRTMALPLLRSREMTGPPRDNELLVTRRRWDALFGIGAVLGAVLGFASWWMTDDAKFLAMPSALVPIWLIVRFSWPKAGVRIRRNAQVPGQDRGLLALGGGIIGGLFTFLALALAPLLVPDQHFKIAGAGWISIALLILCMAPAVILVAAYAPARRAWYENERLKAVTEWEQLACEARQ